MGRIFVISDIHGEYQKFIKMLELIKFSESDRLYILGDVIDRGPEPIRTLHYIMRQSNMWMIIGNHELMALDHVRSPQHLELWLRNGGQVTREQFYNLSKTSKMKIIQYLCSLPFYLQHKHFILVHAGISFRRGVIDDKNTEYMLWSREEFINAEIPTDRTVIVGHTPTIYLQPDVSPMRIVHMPNKIFIDCGAFTKDGRLACLCLNDMEEFYV